MNPLLSRHASTRRRQAGLSLFSLVLWAVILGFAGYVAIRVVPTVNEYFTIQRTVDKIAASAPATVAEARAAFEKQKEIEYAIQSVAAKDLEVTKENDRVVIGFAYEKEIPVAGPVYILLKYNGRSK